MIPLGKNVGGTYRCQQDRSVYRGQVIGETKCITTNTRS